MKTRVLTITGMSCGHCVMSVRKELEKIDGILIEDVQIGSARVSIDETGGTDQDLRRAVEEAGYALTAVREE